MKDSMRTMARPYAILFAIALVVAVLARIGLAVMDAAGWLAYDYISASGVPMLDVICSILTGSAFVAFMFAAALTLMVSAAGAVLQAALFAKGVEGAGKPAAAFLWGWAAAAVSHVRWTRSAVLLPQTAEQGGVAERVFQLGAGIRPAAQDASGIRAAVERVLTDRNYRVSAERIRDGFRRCGGARAAADKILQVCGKQ